MRFGCAVNKRQLVKATTLKSMWIRQKTRDGKQTRYGLGWGVGTAGKHRLIAHGGGQAGTSTYLALLPDKRFVIAVMSNLDNSSPKNLVGQIGRVLLARGLKPE